MRAAIRGDFERLAERRGSQELMREVVDDPPETELAIEREPEEPTAEPSSDEVTESEPPPKSWLQRVLGL